MRTATSETGLTRADATSLAEAFGWAGRPLVEIQLANVNVWAIGLVDAAEAGRRSGAGALLDRDILRAFGSLPEEIAVPLRSLELAHRAVLESVPRWALSWSQDAVTRIFRPVVELTGVLRCATRGERDLEAISVLAADAERGLVVNRAPSWSARAERVGVGLVRDGATLSPSTREHVRPGPRRWLVQERVWNAMVTQGALKATRE